MFLTEFIFNFSEQRSHRVFLQFFKICNVELNFFQSLFLPSALITNNKVRRAFFEW